MILISPIGLPNIAMDCFIYVVNSLTSFFSSSLRKKVWRYAVVMILIYAATGTVKLIVHYLYNDPKFFIYWVFYLLPFCIYGVRYFQIFTTLIIVHHRLDKLVMILKELNLLHSKPKQDTTDSSNTNIKFISQALPFYKTTEYLEQQYDAENSDMKRLLIIRDLYNRLWELTTMLNNDIGISVLSNVGNDFISITANCYWIFLYFKPYSTVSDNFLKITISTIWSTPHLFNILMLALLCERTVQRVSTRQE